MRFLGLQAKARKGYRAALDELMIRIDEPIKAELNERGELVFSTEDEYHLIMCGFYDEFQSRAEIVNWLFNVAVSRQIGDRTLTEEQRNTLKTAAIAASPEVESLIEIMESLTGEEFK